MYHVKYGYILFKYFFQLVTCKLPAIKDLLLEGEDLTRPDFYCFTDYLDLLNECIHVICDIVKENHHQTIEKRLQRHGSESPALRSFNEGDIVYCHFPSKTIISDLKLPSKILQMSFVGPLYIFSKHDKFMYLLSTIDGEVIEHMFHVSHLKRGLLRLPIGKSVRNINDYKLEMIHLRNKDIPQPTPDVDDSSQTSVKTVLHVHIDEYNPTCQDTDTSNIWCQSPSIFQNTILDRRNDLLHLYHVHNRVITSTDALNDTVFSPDESLQGSCNSFIVSKCWFKYVNLQIFCYYSNIILYYIIYSDL